jgi:ribosomal protein L32
MTQTRMHDIVHGKLNERQMERQSKASGLQWCDSCGKKARVHSLYQDLNAAMNIRKCLMLRKNPVVCVEGTFDGIV